MFVQTNIDVLIETTKRLFADQGVPFCFFEGSERLWTDPIEGEGAWFEIGPGLPREYRIYQDGSWIPDPSRVDNG